MIDLFLSDEHSNTNITGNYISIKSLIGPIFLFVEQFPLLKNFPKIMFLFWGVSL